MSPSSSSFLLLLYLMHALPSPSSPLSLPACTGVWQRARGYTYTLDSATGERVWSFCEFQDPRHDHALCGLPDWSEPGFLCDPDSLIGSQQGAYARINGQLRAIQTNTSRQCNGPDGQRQGFIVAVFLLDRVRVGAPYELDSCQNDCGEIYPVVDTNQRAPTASELDVAMETFANRLRSNLKMGACENDLVMVYSREYNRVHTSMGSRVADLLDSDAVSELHTSFLQYVNSGDLEQALLYVAQRLRTDLAGITPALVMLLITMIASGLLLLFMVYYLHLHDTDYNVWGHQGVAGKVASITVNILTGGYVIRGVLTVTGHVSNRLPLWPVIFLFVVSVVSFVLFCATDNLYTRF